MIAIARLALIALVAGLSHAFAQNITVSPSGGGGASGALTLVSTQTASASASLSWTGLTSEVYFFKCDHLYPSATNIIYMRFSEDNGSTWKATNYHYATMSLNDNSASFVGVISSGAAVGIDISDGGASNAIANAIDVSGYIYNLSSSTASKSVTYSGELFATNYYVYSGGAQYVGDTNAVNGIEIIPAGGNLTAGNCSLYGVSQ